MEKIPVGEPNAISERRGIFSPWRNLVGLVHIEPGEVQDHLQEVTEVVGRGYLGFAATLADGRNITWPLTKRERPKIREMPPKVPEELKEKLRCTELGGWNSVEVRGMDVVGPTAYRFSMWVFSMS